MPNRVPKLPVELGGNDATRLYDLLRRISDLDEPDRIDGAMCDEAKRLALILSAKGVTGVDYT